MVWSILASKFNVLKYHNQLGYCYKSFDTNIVTLLFDILQDAHISFFLSFLTNMSCLCLKLLIWHFRGMSRASVKHFDIPLRLANDYVHIFPKVTNYKNEPQCDVILPNPSQN